MTIRYSTSFAVFTSVTFTFAPRTLSVIRNTRPYMEPTLLSLFLFSILRSHIGHTHGECACARTFNTSNIGILPYESVSYDRVSVYPQTLCQYKSVLLGSSPTIAEHIIYFGFFVFFFYRCSSVTDPTWF